MLPSLAKFDLILGEVKAKVKENGVGRSWVEGFLSAHEAVDTRRCAAIHQEVSDESLLRNNRGCRCRHRGRPVLVHFRILRFIGIGNAAVRSTGRAIFEAIRRGPGHSRHRSSDIPGDRRLDDRQCYRPPAAQELGAHFPGGPRRCVRGIQSLRRGWRGDHDPATDSARRPPESLPTSWPSWLGSWVRSA